ncbi:MAG: hypothetical protein AB1324_07950 [Candidatus Micrarchaeota archaeon]
MEMTAKELARLIELERKRNELEFRQRVLGEEAGAEHRAVSAGAKSLRDKASAAGVHLVFPAQARLEELESALESVPPDSIRESLKIRDGKVYALLRERSVILKKNYENRAEIAKISIILSMMAPAESAGLAEAVKAGSMSVPAGVGSLDESGRRRLARVMTRCGFPCSARGESLVPSEDAEKEARIEFSNRVVWVSEVSKGVLEENLRRMQALNSRIQLKNAERQIKVFSEEEETHFATLQREYLDLLKQQDELLKDYREEEKLAVRAD